MNRTELLQQLDSATDKAALLILQRGTSEVKPKNTVYIGDVSVVKNSTGLFDILKNKTILYADITVYDVAVIVANRFNNNEFNAIKKILELESVFNKHHSDMLNYLHCYKGAKKKHDLVRMYILEDKFQISEQRAKLVKNSIARYKVSNKTA